MAAQFAENRLDADRAVERLETLLRVGNRDHLDFFLPAQFYGAVDRLLNRIARTTGDLRTDRTSVLKRKRVAVRVDRGGRRTIQKKDRGRERQQHSVHNTV